MGLADMMGGCGTILQEQALAVRWHSLSLPPPWVHFLCLQICSDMGKPAQSSYDATVDQTSQQGNQQLHCLLNDNGSP